MNVYNTVCGGRSYPASTSTFRSTAADTTQVITNIYSVWRLLNQIKIICYILYDCLICIFTEPLNESSSIFNDLHVSEFWVWNLMDSFNHLDDIIIYCQERRRCPRWVCSTFCWCLQITLAPTSTLVSTPIISLLWCSSSPALEVTLFTWIYNFQYCPLVTGCWILHISPSMCPSQAPGFAFARLGR